MRGTMTMTIEKGNNVAYSIIMNEMATQNTMIHVRVNH